MTATSPISPLPTCRASTLGLCHQRQALLRRDQKSARLSARWELPKFHWDVSAEYYKDDGSPILSLLQTPRPGTDFWSAQIDTAPQTDRYSVGIRSNMGYDLTDHIGLTYIAGWSRVGGTADSDADAGAFPATSATAPVDAFGENRTAFSRYDFWSHEVQLKSTGKNVIDWILGGYYSHEVNKIRFDIDQRNGYRNGTFNWAGSFIQADREIDRLPLSVRPSGTPPTRSTSPVVCASRMTRRRTSAVAT
jgi:iron complex outermembrane receptor protein